MGSGYGKALCYITKGPALPGPQSTGARAYQHIRSQLPFAQFGPWSGSFSCLYVSPLFTHFCFLVWEMKQKSSQDRCPTESTLEFNMIYQNMAGVGVVFSPSHTSHASFFSLLFCMWYWSFWETVTREMFRLHCLGAVHLAFLERKVKVLPPTNLYI